MSEIGASRRAAGQRALGASGERLAANWLAARGYQIVERNWRCAYGEIDVVADTGRELVFVEVKTRRGTATGTPEEAVTAAKRRKLVHSTLTYIQEHGWDERPYRIDVLAVQLTPSGRVVEIRHYPHAVGLEE